ncbi:MAG: SusD/RagB family nutrient-binding outer membrane lipoprotein, partial [Mucilaginibacter sp.]
STRDTTTANQFGYPVGYDQQSVVNAPGYRGTKGGGQNYTQLNYDVVANVLTPQFFITYSQTQLLSAEASFRGWVAGSLSTQLYYESGIKASMDEYLLYPNVQNPAISVAEENSFVNQPLVLYNSANALQLINTQYWISSFVNGPEVFANVRRSGFPVLQTNKYTILSGDGFIHRMAYPNAEDSQNSANYRAAVASMGGDDLTQHIFWDVP